MVWQYLWAHGVFHLIRWFPRTNRSKVRIFILLLTLAFLIPQIFVLATPESARFCGQHLFEFLIVSIVYTFCMIGFSVLFSIMDPIPWEVKLAFHIFGGITYLSGLLLTIFVSLAGECSVTTGTLYFFSLALSIFSVIGIVFLTVMVPFWIVNRIWKNSVLDLRYRTGVCYEPVKCCSCVWHI
ncbi:unnamed protein product [Owenia fusiformis]|uniref:Uncharacterized protein n=1 Tax=Owenia fusiformis TaxID=6347 RepID=A0A8J1UA31_OWEFU|nr:unnamed protein product [Owenia fusiformis]